MIDIDAPDFAIAVIGGLLVSTTFTLAVVPLGATVLARGGLLPDRGQHAF